MNPYRPKLPATYERRARVTDQARAHQALATWALVAALAVFCAVVVAGEISRAFAYEARVISAASSAR